MGSSASRTAPSPKTLFVRRSRTSQHVDPVRVTTTSGPASLRQPVQFGVSMSGLWSTWMIRNNLLVGFLANKYRRGPTLNESDVILPTSTELMFTFADRDSPLHAVAELAVRDGHKQNQEPNRDSRGPTRHESAHASPYVLLPVKNKRLIGR